MVEEYKNLAEIKDKLKQGVYEGYVWGSGCKRPIILRKENYDISEWGVNPYILEALLYDADKETSILIRHTGSYHIYEYNLKGIPKENLIEETYVPHHIKGVERMRFKQLWLPEANPDCAGMEVLQMKALIFTGFVNLKKTEDA